MSQQARTEYLEETFRVTTPGVRELIAEEIGQPQDGYSHLSKDTIEALAGEIGVEPHGPKPILLNRLREKHPQLDVSRTAGQFSREELRELYATVAAGETLDKSPPGRGQLAHV